MDLLELLVAFAARAAFVQVREDVFVVAGIADGQRAIVIGATVEHRAIADPAGRLRARLPEADLAGEPRVGIVRGIFRACLCKSRRQAEGEKNAGKYQCFLHMLFECWFRLLQKYLILFDL